MAKRNGKMVALSIGCVLALALSSGALIRQFATEETTELASYRYTIGAVAEDGGLDKEETKFITSDELKAKDLVSIEVDEEAELTVKVYWYDEDENLLRVDTVTDGTPVAPEGAETFRVEIEPLDDEDGKVSVLEKGGYVKLVTVTLKK